MLPKPLTPLPGTSQCSQFSASGGSESWTLQNTVTHSGACERMLLIASPTPYISSSFWINHADGASTSKVLLLHG